MASPLSPEAVDAIRRQAGEMKTQLGLILNNLDGFPSHVIANLYEGLVKEELETHKIGMKHQQESASRYANRLQETVNSLKRVKFDGRGQETREQRAEWHRNTAETQSSMVAGFDTIKGEIMKDNLTMTAETIGLSCRLIKTTLDTMYQQPVRFQDNFQQKQNQLNFLKNYIPVCIQSYSEAENDLGHWNQVFGGAAGFSGNFPGQMQGQGQFNPTSAMLNNQTLKMRRDMQNQYTAGLLDSASRFVGDVHQTAMNYGSNYGRPYRVYY